MSQLAIKARGATNRLLVMKRIAFWLLVVLFFKVLGSIVFEYRNYFPPNFGSNFLAGRKAHFLGIYRFAFYAHIVSGPITLLAAAFLIFSGARKSLRGWHRTLGKILTCIVLFVMLPSGFVMATQAFTGPIAGIAFFSQSAITAVFVSIAAWHASQRRFAVHRIWAMRAFIMLCSPLLLRLITGATIVFEFENEWTYRFAAWGSWLIPLIIFESRRLTQRQQFHLTEEAQA